MNKKLALKIIAVVTIVFLAGIFIGKAATPTTTFSIFGGNYPSAKAYSIYSDSTTVFSKNALGVNVFSGSDMATVFLNTVDICNDGDTITIACGSYAVNTKLTIDKRINLEGEGEYATTLYSTADIAAIIDIQASYVNIQNLRIDGYGDTDPDCGILINGTGCTLRNVLVISFPSQTGISIYKWSASLDTITVNNCLYGIVLENNDANNIVLTAGSLYTNRANADLILVKGGDTLTVFGTDFEGSATTTAIHITKTSGAQTRMRFIGARFETLYTAFNYSGSGSQGEDYVGGCSFTATVSNIVLNCPSDTRFRDNPGFATESSGSETGLGASQIDISHGLAGTPTTILLSNGDNDSNPYQSSAADSSEIHVKADNGETFYWYCEYQP